MCCAPCDGHSLVTQAFLVAQATRNRERICRKEGKWVTYKPPIAKIPMSACFCLRGRLRPRMTGIGKIMMVKSVKVFMPPLKNHTTY